MCMYVFMCVYMHVCLYVMYVCMSRSQSDELFGFLDHVCGADVRPVCMYVYMYVYVCIHVCLGTQTVFGPYIYI